MTSEESPVRTLRDKVVEIFPALMISLVGLMLLILVPLRWFGVYDGFEAGTGPWGVAVTAFFGLSVLFAGYVLARHGGYND